MSGRNTTSDQSLATNTITFTSPLVPYSRGAAVAVDRFRLPLSGIPLLPNDIPPDSWLLSIQKDDGTLASSYVKQSTEVEGSSELCYEDLTSYPQVKSVNGSYTFDPLLGFLGYSFADSACRGSYILAFRGNTLTVVNIYTKRSTDITLDYAIDWIAHGDYKHHDVNFDPTALDAGTIYVGSLLGKSTIIKMNIQSGNFTLRHIVIPWGVKYAAFNTLSSVYEGDPTLNGIFAFLSSPIQNTVWRVMEADFAIVKVAYIETMLGRNNDIQNFREVGDIIPGHISVNQRSSELLLGWTSAASSTPIVLNASDHAVYFGNYNTTLGSYAIVAQQPLSSMLESILLLVGSAGQITWEEAPGNGVGLGGGGRWNSGFTVPTNSYRSYVHPSTSTFWNTCFTTKKSLITYLVADNELYEIVPSDFHFGYTGLYGTNVSCCADTSEGVIYSIKNYSAPGGVVTRIYDTILQSNLPLRSLCFFGSSSDGYSLPNLKCFNFSQSIEDIFPCQQYFPGLSASTTSFGITRGRYYTIVPANLVIDFATTAPLSESTLPVQPLFLFPMAVPDSTSMACVNGGTAFPSLVYEPFWSPFDLDIPTFAITFLGEDTAASNGNLFFKLVSSDLIFATVTNIVYLQKGTGGSPSDTRFWSIGTFSNESLDQLSGSPHVFDPWKFASVCMFGPPVPPSGILGAIFKISPGASAGTDGGGFSYPLPEGILMAGTNGETIDSGLTTTTFLAVAEVPKNISDYALVAGLIHNYTTGNSTSIQILRVLYNRTITALFPPIVLPTELGLNSSTNPLVNMVCSYYKSSEQMVNVLIESQTQYILLSIGIWSDPSEATWSKTNTSSMLGYFVKTKTATHTPSYLGLSFNSFSLPSTRHYLDKTAIVNSLGSPDWCPNATIVNNKVFRTLTDNYTIPGYAWVTCAYEQNQGPSLAGLAYGVAKAPGIISIGRDATNINLNGSSYTSLPLRAVNLPNKVVQLRHGLDSTKYYVCNAATLYNQSMTAVMTLTSQFRGIFWLKTKPNTFDPYCKIYQYSQILTAINKCFGIITTSLYADTKTAPSITFNPATKLFSLVNPDQLSVVFTSTVQELFYFPTKSITFSGSLANWKYFIQTATTLVQEVCTIGKFNDIATIELALIGAGAKQEFRMDMRTLETKEESLTDVAPDIDSINPNSTLIYAPTNIRWFSLSNPSPITSLTVSFFYRTKEGERLPIYLLPGADWSCKFMFALNGLQ